MNTAEDDWRARLFDPSPFVANPTLLASQFSKEDFANAIKSSTNHSIHRTPLVRGVYSILLRTLHKAGSIAWSNWSSNLYTQPDSWNVNDHPHYNNPLSDGKNRQPRKETSIQLAGE